MNRALRRHHEQRVKANFLRRERRYPIWLNDTTDKVTQDQARITINAGRFAHHGCICSCWMCGNPRRHRHERTLQERRHDANFSYYD